MKLRKEIFKLVRIILVIVVFLVLNIKQIRSDRTRSCVLRIAEIRGIGYGINDYVKLQGICEDGFPAGGLALKEFKFVGLKRQGRKTYVEYIFSLQNEHLSEMGFFTIRGRNVDIGVGEDEPDSSGERRSKASVWWTDPGGKLAKVEVSKQRTMFEILNKEKEILPIGFVLVGPNQIGIMETQSASFSLKKLKIRENHTGQRTTLTTELTADMIMPIKEWLIDFVAIGPDATVDKVPAFNLLSDTLEAMDRYVLRGFSWKQGDQEKAITRCSTILTGIIPHCYQKTTPSPYRNENSLCKDEDDPEADWVWNRSPVEPEVIDVDDILQDNTIQEVESDTGINPEPSFRTIGVNTALTLQGLGYYAYPVDEEDLLELQRAINTVDEKYKKIELKTQQSIRFEQDQKRIERLDARWNKSKKKASGVKF